MAEFLNGDWPTWVSNVANVFQIVGPIIALLAWRVTRSARAGSAAHAEGAWYGGPLPRVAAAVS